MSGGKTVMEPQFQNYCEHFVFFVFNSAIYMYFSADRWAHIKTDCLVGLYCYVFNEFHKPKVEFCTILHQDCFTDKSDMWPLVHLWPQQLSYRYSCSLQSTSAAFWLWSPSSSHSVMNQAEVFIMLTLCLTLIFIAVTPEEQTVRALILFVIRSLTCLPLHAEEWNSAPASHPVLSPLSTFLSTVDTNMWSSSLNKRALS